MRRGGRQRGRGRDGSRDRDRAKSRARSRARSNRKSRRGGGRGLQIIYNQLIEGEKKDTILTGSNCAAGAEGKETI